MANVLLSDGHIRDSDPITLYRAAGKFLLPEKGAPEKAAAARRTCTEIHISRGFHRLQRVPQKVCRRGPA